MPGDLKQKLDAISSEINLLSEERNPEDVLKSSQSYIKTVRSNVAVKQYIETCLTTAPVLFYDFLYHKLYSQTPFQIVSEWERDSRTPKSPTPASGMQGLVLWMQQQFEDYIEISVTKMQICISKQYGFYSPGRPHYFFYKPRTDGLPWEIVSILYQNFRQTPLTSGMILKSIKSKKILDKQDVTSAIKDINDIFKRNTSQDFPLIENQLGYMFNDTDFELELD